MIGGPPLQTRRTERGVTFLELLVAVLILSIVAAGAVKTWSISASASANLRLTEMSSKLAVREIEALKAAKYDTQGTYDANGNPITYTSYALYTNSGAFISRSTTLGTIPSNAFYVATLTVSAPVDSGGNVVSGLAMTGTTADLLEVLVKVTNTARTKTYETQRTLMAFGGF